MIRHTVNIKGDSSLHHAQLASNIPGLQDGDCVKLSEQGNHIYMVYRLSQKLGEKSVGVGLQLMRLNGIEDGACIIEKQKCDRIQHLRVKVNSLDWKIANVNQVRIAQSFLEQMSVVWPQGVVPIYYDDNNFVKLEPMCEKVGRLDVNATVQFIEEEQKDVGNQEQSTVNYQQSISMSGYSDFKDGYLNLLKVNQSLLEVLQLKDEELWIVQNDQQFSGCPSIEELLQFQKQRQKPKNEDDPSNKKLVILSTDETKQISNVYFQCSKLCKKVIGISDVVKVNNANEYKPKIEVISFEIFMNDPNLILKIEEIIQDQKVYSEDDFDEISQRTVKTFAEDLLDILYEKQSFYVLQGLYPYAFNRSLLLLRIENKKKALTDQIFQLKLMSKEEIQKRKQYSNKLLEGKIIFSSIRSPSSFDSSLQQRYGQISKWVPVLKQYFQEEHEKHADDSLEQSMTTLFMSIYQKEVDKMMSFLQNTKQKCCLVTSFGSNGKTFFHRILEKQGERMWKISLRELTDPKLTYSNIELYLSWVFVNSPYSTVYLDDLDALCGKIEQSDQHKKKQKVISKLLLRAIDHYAEVYNRRIIATARSQSGLDQEFRSNTVIILKNPTRELRQAALKKLHVIPQEDDSPIHRVKPLGALPLKESTLKAIAQGTESLTFAAFSKHAVGLTLPTVSTSTKLFDFSKLAGLSAAKNTIRSIIEKPIKYAFLFRSVPIKLPRGVLLYGGTGNGKSALGSALKDEFKMKYFSIKGSDILSKYIGGSQAAVRDIFQKAMSVSPSIIFFDEFESVVPKRSSNNTGVNDRIVNQFLCYLDGVSSISGVYIVATSSRPDLIDPAVLRPGRLDAHIFLDYPTSEERREVVKLYGESVKIQIDQNAIIDETKNFSYSDMVGLFKELRIKRSAEVLKKQSYDSAQFTRIGESLFHETIKTFKLSVNAAQQEQQRRRYEAFRDGRAPDIRQQRQIQQ